jgi:hypothetical protein
MELIKLIKVNIKINNIIIKIDRNSIYNENNSVNLNNFPIEILIEIILSFLFVNLGALFEYGKFEEIYIDKQNSEKVVNHLNNNLFNYMQSKGGMLNHYLD